MIRAHNPALVSEVVAYLLFLEATNDGTYLSSPDISDKLPAGAKSKMIVGYAVKALQNRSFLESRLRNVEEYALNLQGYEYVRYRLGLKGSAIYEFAASEDWILGNEEEGDDAPSLSVNVDGRSEQIGVVKNGNVSVVADEVFPASNRKVSINHNQEPYLSLRKKLEEIVVEFKKDHRLDNELGGERGALESALNGALQLLDDVVVEVGALVTHIIRPLERFVDKYDQAVVGVMAAEAVDLVKQLIEIGLQ